jgi:hypothetical protein
MVHTANADYLITTGLLQDLKLARVLVITKPGERDRTNVKSFIIMYIIQSR